VNSLQVFFIIANAIIETIQFCHPEEIGNSSGERRVEYLFASTSSAATNKFMLLSWPMQDSVVVKKGTEIYKTYHARQQVATHNAGQ
jgi:hypothetical protein